jgi:hypothetical protein
MPGRATNSRHVRRLFSPGTDAEGDAPILGEERRVGPGQVQTAGGVRPAVRLQLDNEVGGKRHHCNARGALRAPNVEQPALEVDVAPAQRESLGDAQAGERQRGCREAGRASSAGSHSPEVDIVDADAGGCPVAGRRG